jgi:hypothetical protein
MNDWGLQVTGLESALSQADDDPCLKGEHSRIAYGRGGSHKETIGYGNPLRFNSVPDAIQSDNLKQLSEMTGLLR